MKPLFGFAICLTLLPPGCYSGNPRASRLKTRLMELSATKEGIEAVGSLAKAYRTTHGRYPTTREELLQSCNFADTLMLSDNSGPIYFLDCSTCVALRNTLLAEFPEFSLHRDSSTGSTFALDQDGKLNGPIYVHLENFSDGDRSHRIPKHSWQPRFPEPPQLEWSDVLADAKKYLDWFDSVSGAGDFCDREILGFAYSDDSSFCRVGLNCRDAYDALSVLTIDMRIKKVIGFSDIDGP